MKLTNLTQKELISKIEELEKEISEKKDNPELTFEGAEVGDACVTKKKTAFNDLLKESESKLKEAQEIAHIGHWNLDIINNKLEWSDEIYRIFGMDPNKFEATYENFLKAIHPDDREFVNGSYIKSLESKTKYNITHRIVLPKGEMRFVREQCKTTYDGSGRPIYSLGTVQDITEVMLATEELIRSEKRFRRLFEDLGDAVYVTKIGGVNKGRILEVNSAAEQQTGYTKNELLNMNIINDISIMGSGKITTDEWEEKLNLGELVTTTEKKRRKDGTEFWTEVIVTSIDFKGERASLSINHDITVRKEAEEKLKKSEEKYHGMIQNLMEGFYSATMDGKLLDYNPEFVRITGLDPNKDHKGIELPDFWQKPEERKSYIENFIKSGFVKNFIVSAKKLNGTKMICLVNSLLVKDEEGKPLRMEGTFLDITERQKAEKEIRKLNEELEDRVKKRTEELSQFQLFADTSNEGFGMADLNGKILYQNKALNILLDEKETQLGKTIRDYYTEDSRKIFEDVALKQIKEIGHWRGELLLRTAKGRILDTDLNFFLIKDENGKPSRIAAIVTDITKRKLAEKELLKKTEDLEAFNNVMIEREIRIIEMKEEVNKLSEQIGLEIPYPPVWKDSGLAD
ncbi:MAG: PAS domain S-box protein [Bacteroidota bacterium]